MKYDAFHTFPLLSHPRFVLGPVTDKHMAAFTEIVEYRTNPESTETPNEMLERMDRQYRERISITWGLFVEGELAGTCGFYRGFQSEVGEIGYVMREKFRRKGLMLDVIRTICEYAFAEMDLVAIEAYTGHNNLPSRKLLEKASFVDTGTSHKGYVIYRLDSKSL